MKQKSLGFRTELLNINYNMNIIFAQHDSCNRAPDNNHCVYNIGEQRVFSTTHWSEWMSVGGGLTRCCSIGGRLEKKAHATYWMSSSVTDVRARTTSPRQYPDSSWLQAPAPFCLRTSLSPEVCLARVQAGEWTPCERHSVSERPKHVCRLLVPPQRLPSLSRSHFPRINLPN